MNDFIPTSVQYEQPVTCTRCGNATFQGIKEFNENGRQKELALCKFCLVAVLQEYMQFLADRITRGLEG